MPVSVEFFEADEIYDAHTVATVTRDVPVVKAILHAIPGQIEGSWEEEFEQNEMAFEEGDVLDLMPEEERIALDAISRFPSEEAAKENKLFIGGIFSNPEKEARKR